MSATDEVITVGDAFPQIDAVSALDRFAVLVRWTSGREEAVDLGPSIFSFKIYAPLRGDRALFETVHVAGSFAIAWGEEDAIDMHVSEIERLAGEVMEAADFKAWMAELEMTRDAAAAMLGISRRMVGYYLSGQEIPRYMALACAHLKMTRGPKLPGVMA